MIKSNKPIIHDTHDKMDFRGDILDGEIIYKYSAGNIYIDYPIKNYAIDKFDIESKPILVLNNHTLKDQEPKRY